MNMKLLQLFLTGWAALAPFTASCSAEPKAGTPDAGKPDVTETGDETPQNPGTTGGKTLVVWYSFTHNSEKIASALLTHISADVLEVEPAEEGLDYAANNYAIGSSQIEAIRDNPGSASSYPAIKAVGFQPDNYDTIIIVTPLWWSQMAAPMQSFLFKYGASMAGKTIGLIVTSASSGISDVEKDAKRLIPQGKFLPESLWIRSSQVGNATQLTAAWYDKMFPTQNETTAMKVKITAGGKSFTAELEDSETGKSFWGKLPLTLEMSELNGNEKYCYGVSLPRKDLFYDTIAAGDLMLYSGNCVVLFYGAAGGYSYTRIGKIANVTGLAAALGTGDVSVKFEKQ